MKMNNIPKIVVRAKNGKLTMKIGNDTYSLHPEDAKQLSRTLLQREEQARRQYESTEEYLKKVDEMSNLNKNNIK